MAPFDADHQRLGKRRGVRPAGQQDQHYKAKAEAHKGSSGSFLYALGVLWNSDAQFGGPGDPFYTSFAGETLTGAEVLVKFTYFGDADLSGAIDATDYSLIDNGYVNALAGWVNGDFDYSGAIDATDYAVIDNAYVNQSGPLAESMTRAHAAMFGSEYTHAVQSLRSGSVPEPKAVLVYIGGVMVIQILRHRRRARPKHIGTRTTSDAPPATSGTTDTTTGNPAAAAD
ncbi:MAG TPA: hypothetical protein VNL70_04160 [Tepidisphaeraceae bacterium]|nr:hypothetical protein [Tepidisphaeraceae bacterium]